MSIISIKLEGKKKSNGFSWNSQEWTLGLKNLDIPSLNTGICKLGM